MNPTLIPDDWQGFEYTLSWLERINALLERCGGLRLEDQLRLGALARALLMVVSGGPLPQDVQPVPTPEPTPEPPAPVVQEPPAPKAAKPKTPQPRRPRVPAAPANGHPEPGEDRWSLNDRLRHLGYPEDLDRGTRIALGQCCLTLVERGAGIHARGIRTHHPDRR